MSTNLNTPFEIDFLENTDHQSVIAELQRIATKLGKKNVTLEDLEQHGRVGYHLIVNRFGTLRHALEAAGLRSTRYSNATDAEMIKLVQDLWTITRRESGRSPRKREVAQYDLPVSADTIMKRFGSWKNALLAAANTAAGKPVEVRKRPRKRRDISYVTRFMVLKRAKYRCQICHRAGVDLEVDHVVPVGQGGSNRIDNLQAACFECNRGKGKKMQ